MSETLPARRAINFPLRAGAFLQLSGSGTATVNLGGGASVVMNLAVTSQTIGPFRTGGHVALLAGPSPISYSVLPAAPAIIVSPEDPDDGDGMPDGTVWIQTT